MIKQFIISDSVKFFADRIASNYPIKCVNEDNYDKKAPCLFIGNYRQSDLRRINEHEGFAVVLWCGIDVERKHIVRGLKPSVKHIATSHWAKTILSSLNIDYRFINYCTAYLNRRSSEPLGDKIYCYAPNEIYGKSLAEDVGRQVDYELILTISKTQYSPDQINEFYRQSFMGIRLRDRSDGSATTVQEMALMGRRTIWNGDQPAAIHWKDKSDIIRLIGEEAKKIGTIPTEVTEITYNYFNINNDWLNEEFYE